MAEAKATMHTGIPIQTHKSSQPLMLKQDVNQSRSLKTDSNAINTTNIQRKVNI